LLVSDQGEFVVNFGNSYFGQQSGIADPLTGVTIQFKGAPFALGKTFAIVDITDGTSNTMMWAETISPIDSPGWDGPIAETQIAIGGQTFETIYPPNAKYPDLVVRQCPTTNLNGIYGCTVIGQTGAEQSQVFITKSKHSGGVNVGFCDGSVRFIKNTISVNTFRSISTTQGNEQVSADSY
jgi:prepilin-type processing-associated H-X9-DG protein